MKSEGARGETRLAKGYMIQSARDATGREKEAMAREMERAVEWAVVMFQGLRARVAHRMRATPASTAGSVDGCVGGDTWKCRVLAAFHDASRRNRKLFSRS